MHFAVTVSHVPLVVLSGGMRGHGVGPVWGRRWEKEGTGVKTVEKGRHGREDGGKRKGTVMKTVGGERHGHEDGGKGKARS